MKSFAICILLASVCALFTQDLKAQIADQWLYNDTLVSPWIDLSWSVTNTMNSTEQVFDGSSSIKSVMGAYGGLRLHSGIWGSPVDVNPADYSHLEFSLYSATAGFALAAYVENSGDTVSPDFLLKNFPVNQWVNVAIPIGNIDSTNIRINRIVLRNCASLDNTIFIDNLRLVGKPDSTITPSAPTLLSPATSATNQLKRPVLSWLSSAGATSYHLQVSTSSSFSSTVFDDSTLFLTLKQITNLAVSTTYYWRVSAKNANGTSAYSSSFHFTTSAQNASDRWVYQDTLTPRWTTVPSWSNTSLTLQQNVNVYSGTYSVKAEENSWGGVIFRSGDWFPPIEVDPSDYEAAEVVIFNTTPGLSINVCIGNDDSGWTPGLTYWDLPINQWVILNVPMGQLNPSNFVIHDLIIRNYTGNDATYYIDDVRFIALGATGVAPSTPVLVSPTLGIRTPSVTPTLSWKSSVGSTSYHVQVSSDSTYSNPVVDDSTLTTTVKTLPALSFNTNYYWRVKAINSSGSSSFSASRHFITQADTIPFPAILQDEFNAANGSLDGRMNWVDIESQPNSGTMSIDSNAVIPSSSAGVNNFGGVVWDTLMGAGTEIRTILKQKSGEFSSPSLFLYARMDNKDYSTGTGYRLAYREQSGTDKLEIQKVTGGYDNATSLVTIYQELNIGDTLTFRVLSDNKTMIGRINGVNEIHVADETYLPSQWYYAVRGCVFTTPVRIDDFMASAQSSPLLSPPSLAAPSNGSTNQSAFSNLRWHPAAGTILDYSLQVSTDSNFSSLVFNDSTITDTSRMMTKLLLSSTYYWRVAARNSSGRGSYSTAWQFATRPDTIPTLIASDLDPTVPSLMFNANRFLFSGINAVQFSLDTSKVGIVTCATIRGRVFDVDNSPLAGVKVSILHRPELGYTFTRSDGLFDMLVSGGGPLTVDYHKDGFLPAQRQLSPIWQEYEIADDAILVRLDSSVTRIDLGDSAEVAQGSEVTDDRGTRRSTLIFHDSTTAILVFPDSSTQSVSSIHVRATEYTIGANGKTAMPAKLPPLSQYTYCMELSSDEAILTGAESIQFSQQVAYYVENFINAPVGTAVPVGYYDKKRGVWVPSEDGIVLKVVSTTGDSAHIDMNGDNVADIPESLSVLGITSSEKKKLASLYASGTTLWRVPVKHFTAYDCNYGSFVVNGADLPRNEEPNDLIKFDQHCKVEGSVIDAQNQSLGENFPLTGTPYLLNYTSSLSEGNRSNYSLTIPVVGAILPPNVSYITTTIDVAGKRDSTYFSRGTNLNKYFTWDGKDAFGRTLNGEQSVKVQITYWDSAVYRPRWYRSCYWPYGFLALCPTDWNNEAFIPAPPIPMTQTWTGAIGTLKRAPKDLGGLEFNVHHTYEPASRILHFGNGTERYSNGTLLMKTIGGNGSNSFPGGIPPENVSATSAALPLMAGVAVASDGTIYVSIPWYIRKITPDGIVTTYAGNGGFSTPNLGDGGPALSALITSGALAIGPDSALYLSDASNHRIRRIDKNGTITSIAGTTQGFGGDSGLALSAKLNTPGGISFAPDGSLYVADMNNDRVRKISTNGIIATVAGYGANGAYASDGRLATLAVISRPNDVAVAQDGTFYIATTYYDRLLRVTVDGRINTISGGGTFGSDGLPANSDFLVDPIDLSIGSDGTLYLVESGRSVIRTIGTDNIISTIAGTGSAGYNKDLGFATGIALNTPVSSAVGPDGSLYICDKTNNRLRKVEPVLPGVSVTDITVASEDASELYVFSSAGRHMRTIDALTSNSIYGFNYDSLGRVASIVDKDSLVTVVVRDSLGHLSKIQGPYGQSTKFTTDSLGFVTRIIDPAHDTTQLSISSTGLLNSMADPKKQYHYFTYDSLGRLTRDENPTGGFKALNRSDSTNGYAILISTAEERSSKYVVQKSGDGRIVLTNVDQAGLRTITSIGGDGARTTVLSDSVIINLNFQADPRFGLQSPIVSSVTKRMPSSLQSNMSEGRLITQMTGQEVTGFKDSMIINGNVFRMEYDGSQRLFTNTSAEGRRSYTRHDSLGHIIQDSIPGIVPTNYRYDSNGRIIEKSQRGQVISYSYDTLGRVASITDPLLLITQLRYDSANRVTKQILPTGREITFTYDVNGNVTGITPPARPKHIFEYTTNDLNAKYLPPFLGDSARSTNYQYNLDDQLTRITRPDSLQIHLEYDTLSCGCGSLKGMLKSVTFDRGQLLFSYDSARGTLKRVIGPENDTLTYSYDGSLLTKESWGGDVRGNVQYSYDSDFRVIKEKINGTDSIGFSYDKDGFLKKAGSLSISRDGQTALVKSDTVGSVTSSRNYDSFGSLSQLSYRYGGSNLYGVSYLRDSLKRIISLEETIQEVTKNFAFTYDSIGRVSTVRRNDTLISHYYYDANGNRDSVWKLSGGTTVSTHDDQDKLLTSGNEIYLYTKNGELSRQIIGTDTTKYTYDHLGNLTKVILANGDVIEYLVDGLGRRIGRKVNGSLLNRWLYSGQLTPVAELDSSNALTTRFILDYMVKGDSTYRMLRDHLGSVRLVVNAQSGTIAQRIDYDEFGVVTTNTNEGFTPFGFGGALFESQTGLTRFGARDYNASLGRWTLKDPIGFGGGVSNLYEYVSNDPINRIDMNGKQDGILSSILTAFERYFFPALDGTSKIQGAIDDQAMLQRLKEVIPSFKNSDEVYFYMMMSKIRALLEAGSENIVSSSPAIIEAEEIRKNMLQEIRKRHPEVDWLRYSPDYCPLIKSKVKKQ